eukprot:762723-Hanusia_phi.AAC.11
MLFGSIGSGASICGPSTYISYRALNATSGYVYSSFLLQIRFVLSGIKKARRRAGGSVLTVRLYRWSGGGSGSAAMG